MRHYVSSVHRRVEDAGALLVSIATSTNAVTDWMTSVIATAFAAATPPLPFDVYIAAAPWDEPRPVRNADAPYVTIRHITTEDRMVIGGDIIASVGRFEVSAWEEGTDTSRIKPIVESFHAALHGKRGGVVDGMVISGCVRELGIERQVVEGDYLYTQMGGEYIVRLSVT